MLQELTIKNYALIDHLQINFGDGFSVITGETGSGKSIILGALGLIMGQRIDSSSVRNPSEKCVVEGSFKISSKDFKPMFEKLDLDYDLDTIIRREISPSGKSRAFINDTPVSLNILKEVSEKLIDIHSQHETLQLNDKSFLFDIVDSQIEAKELIPQYESLYNQIQKNKKELSLLKTKEAENQQNKDFLEFQLNEFKEINLKELADKNFDQEYNILSNAEDIKRILGESINYFEHEQNGVLNGIQEIKGQLTKLSQIDDSFNDLLERLESSLIELKDLSDEINSKESHIELDENKLKEYDLIFSVINKLQHKHQLTGIDELLEKQSSILSELQQIEGGDELANILEKEIKSQTIELIKVGKEIRKSRLSIIPGMENEAKNLLQSMSMKHAEIKFELVPLETPSIFGLDDIQLLAKTNLGSQFELLKKVASGGETSRIMLSIKALQSENKSLPTIIFDEIDTGVSGEVASNMADIMKKLSQKMQLICITHLPQIASKGKHHYKVQKQEENNTTLTHITHLSSEERTEEIAKMLSNNNPSKEAIENAKALLNG